jgi:tetratricopeptide (TPR) repeat protein
LPVGVTPEQFDAAAMTFYGLQGRDPDRSETLMLVGELAAQHKDWTTAAAAWNGIPADHPVCGPASRVALGEARIRLSQARQAEEALLAIVALDTTKTNTPPDDIAPARDWLRYLYSVELRFEDRRRILERIHQAGNPTIRDSKEYYFPSLLVWNSERGRDKLREFLENAPHDPILNVAAGRYLTGEGRPDEARDLLSRLHAERPGDRACLAALLEANYELDDWETLHALLGSAPPVADDDPWLLSLLRGAGAAHQGQWNQAVASYQRLLLQDATNSEATMGLAIALAKQGRAAEAESMRRRSQILARLRPQLLAVTEEAPDACLAVAAECDLLKLTEAAEVFRRHAGQSPSLPADQSATVSTPVEDVRP